MHKFYLPYLLVLLCGAVTAQIVPSQHPHPHSTNVNDYRPEVGPAGISKCATVEVDAWRRNNNPNLPSIDAFEAWFAPRVRAKRAELRNSTAASRNVIIIPVVVHVLHNGEPIGTAPNITDAQAISQVTVMDEDFRRKVGTRGFNNDAVGADLEIEFRMAQTDPNGNPTTGVNHVNINQDGATRDNLENTIKPATIWDPNQYLNMWCVKFAAPDDNLLGYAQFPESSGLDGMPAGAQGATTDGVVMRFQSFGTSDLDDGTFILDAPYDLGRTATHEVGHWIGLRHIWGDGAGCNLGAGAPGCSCTADDFCADTPNSDNANYRCPLDKTSDCDNNPLTPATSDMVRNYMDYSNDDCMNIFTQDQKARALTVMDVSPRRKELKTSIAHLPPAPYITLASEVGRVTEGSSCGTTDVEVTFNISQASTTPTTVNLSVDAANSTATTDDYQLSPNSFVFPANTTTEQTFTFQLDADFVDEDTETLVLNFTTSGGGLSVPNRTTYTLTIEDDDHGPLVNGLAPASVAFTAGEFASWTGFTSTGSAVQFAHDATGAATSGMTGEVAYVSLVAGGAYAYNQVVESNCTFHAPAFDATGWKNLEVQFTYTVDGELDGGVYYDYGEVVYSVDGSNWISAGTPLAQPVGSPQTTPATTTVSLGERAANQSDLRVGIRWVNDGLVGQARPIAFDNFTLRGDQPTPAAVATEVNTTNQDERRLGPNQTVHFYDPATGNVMATLQNNSAHDYGCTSVYIDRSSSSAGAATTPFWNNDPANALISKSFRVVPTTDHPNGNITTTLYFTDAEIQNWMTATGQSMANIELVKVKGQGVDAVNADNGGTAQVEIAGGTLAAYNGSGWQLTGTTATGFSGFAAGVAGAVLPVELTALTARTERSGIRVAWTTATELNNDYFTVEHSPDGVVFRALGTVRGAGTTETPQDYAHLDHAPTTGTNYYRLRQTDFDGTTTTSAVVSARWVATDGAVAVTPNPATDAVVVRLDAALEEANLRLVNALGQPLEVRFRGSGAVRHLDVSELAAGMYTLEVRQETTLRTVRLVKR